MADINLITAQEYNIQYYKNDKFEFSITVNKDSSPVDFSTKTLKMQVKLIKNRANYITEFSTSDSTIVVSGVNNNILTFTTDYAFKAGTYYFDLDNQTDKETIMYGKLMITQDVTR